MLPKKNPNTIMLPNFETLFISGDIIYSLTPFEKINIDTYATNQLTDYQKALIDFNNNDHYSSDGKKFYTTNRDGDKVELDKSIAKQKAIISSEDFSVDVWIKACHVILIKSVQEPRLWLLHYDPLQMSNSDNQCDWDRYTRPNYCDLNPKIPYEVTDVSIRENEKVDILVLHTKINYDRNFNANMMEGNFDEGVLKNRLGDRINSIEYISLRQLPDEKNKDIKNPIFDIKIYPKKNWINVVRRDDKENILNMSFQPGMAHTLSIDQIKNKTISPPPSLMPFFDDGKSKLSKAKEKYEEKKKNQRAIEEGSKLIIKEEKKGPK